MRILSDERALDKISKRRDRYEIPDWQRQEVWDRAKKQQLIDSILRGWRLPKFYFLRVSSDPEQYEVVDGQQRLSAIFDFFDNALPLAAGAAQEFGGPFYNDLPTNISDRFDDFQIQFDVIEEGDEKEIKEFFQRLQQGLQLSSSEKLNALQSKLRDFAKKLSRQRFFEDKVAIADRRYAHLDIVAKVAAIEIDGIDTGLRYDDLKDLFESQASFSSRSNTGQRLTQTFEFLDRMFESRSPLLKNRTVVQSLATLVSRLIAGGHATNQEGRIHRFFKHFMSELARQVELGEAATDTDYLRFQRSVNANVRSGARVRHEVLLRKLLTFDPSAFDLLDPTAVAEGGPTASIKDAAERIGILITSINEAYSAQHGENLFKPTNRTTASLARIGKRIADWSGYQTFLDDLYFLFRESPGLRLADDVPTSFSDVNQLRTDAKHDVDHGELKKVAAKKKKSGATFKKYSGATSPFSLAPERFPLLQANMLAALESDLRILSLKHSGHVV
ncbi:MAG: DUF262 domain-containing protein [Vicinamibacteria bacterium]